MNNYREIEEEKQVIAAIQREIDIIIAVLLLTGQLTVIRVYIIPGGFGLSVGGPLTGRSRLEGKEGNKVLSFGIDLIDILLAILLFRNDITLEGIFLGPGRFSFNISGPIFGIPKPQPILPDIQKIYNEFRVIITEQII